MSKETKTRILTVAELEKARVTEGIQAGIKHVMTEIILANAQGKTSAAIKPRNKDPTVVHAVIKAIQEADSAYIVSYDYDRGSILVDWSSGNEAKKPPKTVTEKLGDMGFPSALITSYFASGGKNDLQVAIEWIRSKLRSSQPPEKSYWLECPHCGREGAFNDFCPRCGK